MEKACLVMMVKNESENIERALRSVEGLWSHFVIGFDKSTTDDTEMLVRQWMLGREHLGYFHHFDWPNSFADARNMHLNLAYEHYPECRYILSFDGDDLLCPRSRPFIQSWLEQPHEDYFVVNGYVYLDSDNWGIPFLVYPRVHIILNSPSIRYIGSSHNVIDCPSERQLLVQQLIIWHKQAPNKRKMRESQRLVMNISNLTAAATDDPADARSLFYLANTKLDAGQYEEAEATYQTYLDRSTWPEERYQAHLHLAAVRFLAGDLAGAKERVWQALREPNQYNRGEAYMHLGDCALAEGHVGEALHWYSITGEMPPPVSSMFLQGAVYTYLPHWRLTLLYDKIGEPFKAYQHAQRAYQWRPSPDIEAALRALEETIAAAQTAGPLVPCGPMPVINSDLPLATQILPIPEAELERLLAEIPVSSEAA